MRWQRPHHGICDAHSLPPFCATSASPVPQTRSVPRAQRACETEPCNERTLKPTAARRCGAASYSKRAARLPSAVRCNEPVCTGREKIDREAAHLAHTSTWLSPAASPTLILDGLAAGPPVGDERVRAGNWRQSSQAGDLIPRQTGPGEQPLRQPWPGVRGQPVQRGRQWWCCHAWCSWGGISQGNSQSGEPGSFGRTPDTGCSQPR